ncbi:MAG: DUF3857 domain-containing protein [Pseudomonadota bacterium]|nr:DUF3857 domain-containing protein [Pseudomonadota bacterium]
MFPIRAFFRFLLLGSLLLGAAQSQSQNQSQTQTQGAPSAPALGALPDTAMKEVPVGADSFVRNAPLPTWAEPLALPPAVASQRALVVRLDDTQLWVAERPVVFVNTARQANDPGALGPLGQISLAFVPQYQRLLLHKVAIRRGEQTIDHTATVQVRFLQREVGLEQGIYSGVITANLLLPDVRVGDTLLLQYAIEGANPILGRRYVQGIPWQTTVPVQMRRVTLIEPENRGVQWQLNTDGPPIALQPEVTVRGGLRRLRFEARDLPALELEPAVPRGAAVLPWLQFSEFADWAEVARWADPLFPPDADLPPEAVALVQRWLRLPSAAEQASQALQWVQNEIRYVSVSFGESSHRPHSPAEVLRNRYGDCKDKSFLLMRLLQSLGLPARTVLASLSAPQGPARGLPSPLAFDHAVVELALGGRAYDLDATRLGQRGALDRMGQGLEEASVLVVDGKATTGLSVVRSPNRRTIFHSELDEKFKLEDFDADGELDSTQQWNGLPAEVVRLTLARLDKDRLQQTLTAGLQQRYPGIASIGAPEFTDEVDLNRLTLHARYKIPKLAARVDGNWVMRFVPANLQGAVANPPSPTRRLPLAVPAFPLEVSYSAEMQWPTSVAAVFDPNTVHVANRAFSAEVVRSFRGNVARIALRFESLAPAVAAADVPAMVADVTTIDRAIGGSMVVAPGMVKKSGVLGLGRQTLRDSLLARAQSSVNRTSTAIDGGQLSGDDLAQALCARAEGQIQLGRTEAAQQDAQRAVKEAPTLALAWFCLGTADWARGDFAAADADLGKALVFGQSASDVYFRRGQARFFAGRLEAAEDDFRKAAADRPESSEKLYAQLWQATTLHRLGRPLPADLTARADPGGAWPHPALALFTGAATPEDVMQKVDRMSGDERELAATEGWFYVGEYQLLAHQPDKAREAFARVRAAGITSYIEYAAAQFELERLGR